MSPLARILTTVAFAGLPLLAQAPTSLTEVERELAAKKVSNGALAKEFKTRLFVVQHRSPKALCEVVRPLGSGAQGSAVEYTDRDGLKTISVRDLPENLATIEAALKRLDVPAAAQVAQEVELHIHVLLAAKAEGSSEGFPEELKDVLKSLRATLAFRSFTPLTSFVQRVKNGGSGVGSDATLDAAGFAEAGEKGATRLRVEWQARDLEITPAGPAGAMVSLRDFRAEVSVQGSPVRAAVGTDLTLKDGEKVVVGTTALKDKGLIVVVTAKVLK